MQLLDVVSPLRDLPEQHVAAGQVGTIVDELDAEHVMVEFADTGGITIALVPLPRAALRLVVAAG
jgi:hypothetical protein